LGIGDEGKEGFAIHTFLKDNQEAIINCASIFPEFADRLLPVWFSTAPANDSRAILNIVMYVVNRPGKQFRSGFLL